MSDTDVHQGDVVYRPLTADDRGAADLFAGRTPFGEREAVLRRHVRDGRDAMQDLVVLGRFLDEPTES